MSLSPLQMIEYQHLTCTAAVLDGMESPLTTFFLLSLTGDHLSFHLIEGRLAF